MSAYHVINSLISKPKHYGVGTQKNRHNETVLLSTVIKPKFDVLENINNFTLKNCVYLDYDLYSMQIYASVHKLNLKHYR